MNVARLRLPVYALALSILAAAASCGTADVPPKKLPADTGSGGDTMTTTGTAGSSSSTAGSSGTTGTGGAGGAGGTGSSTGGGAGTMSAAGGAGGSAGDGAGGTAVAMCPPPDAAIPLPVVVDTFYAASGYMGDGATMGSIAATADCPMRGPGNIGNCAKFTYTPIAGGLMWGGVYWQSPANNWGTLPGKHIEAGAATRWLPSSPAASGREPPARIPPQ
jgi:hypothetical protein